MQNVHSITNNVFPSKTCPFNTPNPKNKPNNQTKNLYTNMTGNLSWQRMVARKEKKDWRMYNECRRSD